MSATVGAIAKLGGCDRSRCLGNEDIPNSSSTADRRSCTQKDTHIINEDTHVLHHIMLHVCTRYMYMILCRTIHAEGESLIPHTQTTLTHYCLIYFCLYVLYIHGVYM